MRDATTRLTLAFGAAIALTVSVMPAEAGRSIHDIQYCAREYDGTMDCAYFTLRQCLAAVSGTGGDCAVNPRYVGNYGPGYRKSRRVVR